MISSRKKTVLFSVFGLDALSSAAYGPEAALTLLMPLDAAGSDTLYRLRAGRIRKLSAKIA